MTTEKIYSSIIEMVKAYAEERGENLDFVWDVLKDPIIYAGTPGSFYGRAAEILLDCREKMDKKTAGAGRLSVCKRMAKECKGETLAGIHETGDRYAITDGYRAFRFTSDVSSIQRAAAPFDFDKCFSGLPGTDETLPSPSRADIKAFIAAHGLKRSKPNRAYTPKGWPEEKVKKAWLAHVNRTSEQRGA